MSANQAEIRTRFAPSPTGMMHVGNFRTALYAYLFAKKHQGKFVLRIEDTDKSRQVAGAEESILRVLRWAGLKHDEGPDIGGPCGPYRQSERLSVYHKYIKELIKKGKAYYCFCSPERLEKMRREQQARGEQIKYDRHCLRLSQEEIQNKLAAGEPYVIRQKVDTHGETNFKDLVRGNLTIQNKVLDDSVLIKSDGYPTYNFANVIDDHLMGITHVIRGEEYINSTPKYIQLYQAFGWPVPQHAHLSLILNKNRSKLSKRDGDVAVEDYIRQGYLPAAVVNFVALLGWNPGDDRELFTLEELIHEFDFSRVHKSGAVFDLAKLDWMNGHYIRQTDLEELTQLCRPYLADYLQQHYQIDINQFDSEYLKLVVGLEQERLKKLSEIGERTAYFFVTPVYPAELLVWKKADRPTTLERLKFLIGFLEQVPEENWTRQTLEEALIEKIKQQGYSNGDTLWPMRVALSGQERSPSPFEIAEVLGKVTTLERLKAALEKLNQD